MSKRSRTWGPVIGLIVDGDEPGDQIVSEAQRVLSHWTDITLPALRVESAADLTADPKRLRQFDAAWVWSSAGEGSTLRAMLDEIEQASLPALLTRGDESQVAGYCYQHGVILCPPNTKPTVSCAMLQALCSQSPIIDGMRGELAALRHTQGGLADQIDKIDEEMRLASQLQREFLPEPLPVLKGVDFRVLWRPAGYVSGDIYDLRRLDEHHIGFFVADAVGHGVPAALLTMFVKRSLKTKIIDDQAPDGYRLAEPAEALTRLNHDLLARQSGNARFVTACYGVIDTRTRDVRLARAGHPYPIVLTGDGQRHLVQPEGGLLGVFDEATFDQVRLRLQDHERLVVYTDGFELAFPDEGFHCGQADAAGHYTEQFEILANGELDEGLKQLASKVDQQTGSLNQQDDLTALCLDAGVRDQKATHGCKTVRQTDLVSAAA